MTTEQYKEIIEDYKVVIKDYKSLISDLKADKKRMSAELIELKDINAGQSQFLDALENLLLDYGYKLVDANE